MRAPDHWTRRSPLAWGLAPVGVAYGLVARLRQALAHPPRVGVPVVCVGNVTVGGAGKTPTAIAIARMLLQSGHAPHFLSRGYGGALAGPLRVDPVLHRASDVGDEPLLLAEEAPCWVARDRHAGAAAAVAAGADVVIMDDGLQNIRLAKTLNLVVVDGQTGFGNGFVLPAGPLREFAGDGLRRAQAVVLIAPVAAPVERMLARLAGAIPVLTARFVPRAPAIAGRRVFAFSGIARPGKFFASLGDLGCDVAGTAAFPDHHPFTDEELAGLTARARAADALLVTTAKDHVRLSPDQREGVARVDGTLAFDRPETMAGLLTAAISA